MEIKKIKKQSMKLAIWIANGAMENKESIKIFIQNCNMRF